MTVQRQYTLPNCNLVLEGLSADANDPLSPMAVLMNVECQLPGATDATLTGGREFLDNLIAAVSHYAQQLLSGIMRPLALPGEALPLVDVKPGDGPYHHLIVRQQTSGERHHDTDAMVPLDVKLSTVQFYDLMEAIDQLLADNQTLPDLKPQFQAVSRRLVKPAEPAAKRAAPAVIGAAALAAAGLGLFFLPPPEFEPSRPSQESEANLDTPEAASAPTVDSGTDDDASPTAEGLDLEVAAEGVDRWANAPAITDGATLAVLQRDLTRQLEDSWAADPPPEDALDYRVTVSENGDILGYKYLSPEALDQVETTALARLAFRPVDEAEPVQESVAQFKVSFTPEGQVEVASWDAEVDSPAAAEDVTDESTEVSATTRDAGTLPDLERAITDGETIKALNRTLYDSILSNLDPLSANEALEYQVRVTESGDIVGYEPLNTSALLLADETPLPDLLSPGTRTDAQADYRVVFTAGGVLEVSPWDGWPD